MGAAPVGLQTRKPQVVATTVLAALVVLGLCSSASAARMPSSLWAVESSTRAPLTAPALRRIHHQGMNAVVAVGAIPRERRAALAAAAERAGLVAFFAQSLHGVSASSFCRAARRAPGGTCAILVSTPRAAVLLARRNVADAVVLRLHGLGPLAMLRGVKARTHILALVRVPSHGLDRRAWSRALAITQQDATLDLAVSAASRGKPGFNTFLGLMATARSQKQAAGTEPDPSGDLLAPSAPLGVTTTGGSPTSIGLTWTSATDNVGVAGYGVYVNGTSSGSTTLTSFSIGGLACGTTYALAVDAYDAAGNRSTRTSITVSTAACGTGGDAVAPGPPGSPTKTGSAATAVSISWAAATDNVGVAGYGVYRNGTLVATTTGTSATVTGLACGTSYTLAVDAYDAAGNRSAKSSLTASTSACSGDTQAPTAPTGLKTTATTTTSVSLAWNVSSDNVGVTGYGLYRDGGSAGSVSGTTGTVSGLSCGTSYTLAVDAADAASNRSGKTSITAATATCGGAGGGGGGGSASVFVSPSGADGNACTQSKPCKSFDRAYAVAAPGATVEVAAGSYPTQVINSSSPNTGADILFRPASGASVTLADLEVTSGAHIEFRDFHVSGDTYNRAAAQYITYRNIDMGLLYVRGADHISYLGGDVGPNDSSDYMNWITEPGGSSDPAQDILLDGISIHDFTKHNAGSHVDCLGLGNSDNVVIRNSRFWDCEHFAIIPGKDPSGGSARNLTIENNFIECCVSGYYSIGLGDASGVTIRFNSIADAGIGWLGGTVTNVTIDSNVIDTNNSANCSQATWRYNVVASGSACGGILGATGFVGAPTNLHLAPSALAINAGNPSSYPSTDIDGNPRPAGGRPDAGAVEAG